MIIRRTLTSSNPPQNEYVNGAFTGIFFLLWAIIIVLII
jgi:hypothetical protein